MNCKVAKLQPRKLSILRNSGKQSTTSGKSRAQSLEAQLSKAGRSNPTTRRVSKLPNVVTCKPVQTGKDFAACQRPPGCLLWCGLILCFPVRQGLLPKPVIALQYGRYMSHSVPNFAGALRHSTSDPLQIVVTIPSLSRRSVKL